MSEEPMIYTSKGNVPESSLKYEVTWDINEDYIAFKETWADSSGEVVKASAHVRGLKPFDSIGASQQQIGMPQ